MCNSHPVKLNHDLFLRKSTPIAEIDEDADPAESVGAQERTRTSTELRASTCN